MDKINLIVLYLIIALAFAGAFIFASKDTKILGFSITESNCNPNWNCVWGECIQEQDGFYSYPKCQDLNECNLKAPERKQCFTSGQTTGNSILSQNPQKPEGKVTNLIFMLGILLPIAGLIILGLNYFRKKNIEEKPYLYQSQAV